MSEPLTGFVRIQCETCGIPFAITAEQYSHLKVTHKEFYCPYCCETHYYPRQRKQKGGAA